MEKICLAETDQMHLLILLGMQLNYIHQTIVDYLHLTHIYITLPNFTHEMNRSKAIKNVRFSVFVFSLLFVCWLDDTKAT